MTASVRHVLVGLAAGVALAAAGCGKPIDIKQTVQMVDVSGGYHDAGIVAGERNKIVPSVTFRLKKTTDDSLRPLSINAVFKKLTKAAAPAGSGSPAASEEDWEDVYVQTVDFNGNETGPVTIRTTAGYTADPPQSRADILHHSQFQDVRVHIFAKHSSTQWVEIGQFDIPRQLLTQ